MELRHEASHDLPIDHPGNYRDTGVMCLVRENSAAKIMSRDYHELDRRTMEPRH